MLFADEGYGEAKCAPMKNRNKNRKKMQLSHKTFVMISLGGALGALSRFYLSVFIENYALQFGQSFRAGAAAATAASADIGLEYLSHQFAFAPSVGLFFYLFPLAILLINMFGSLALGLLLAYMQHTGNNNIPLRNFVIIGFLGSFTTFSTFIIDSIELVMYFLVESVVLREIFPHLKDISYPLGTFFPFYAKEFLLSHSILFSLGNIILNLVLCIVCVAVGHGIMKKMYSIR